MDGAGVAEAWPAGMVTVVGTEISEGSLLASETTSAAERSVLLRVTVTVAAEAPAFSAMAPGAIATVRVS